MNRKYIPVYLTFLILLGASSCQKQLDVTSSHMTTTNHMWQVKNDARSALFATYGLLRAALANNNAWFIYGEMRAGDFESTGDPDLKSVILNNLNATSTEMEDWKNWRRFYAAITQSNLCIDKLPLVHENDFRYTDDELNLDLANVRFIRALSYFYLVRIWGDVPLVTTVSEGDFPPEKRVSSNTILDFITQEVLEIVPDLPWQYNGQFPEQQGNYWDQNGSFWKGKIATKGAAYALLAHIYAWRGDYLSAAKYCKLITDNNSQSGFDYSYTSTLTSTTGGVFKGQSDDIIFFLSAYKEYQESSATGHLEAWTLADPFVNRQVPMIYVPNDTIVDIFNEQNDERFYIDTTGHGFGNYFYGFGNPVPLFSKIRLISTTGSNPLANYESGIVIFRYEEIELLEAESLYFLGKSTESLHWLNAVRGQRGLPDFEGTGPELAEAILRERRRELMGEGWRWFDLIRFQKVSEYTRLTQQDIDQGALVWPVAKDILAGNKNIQQNPYWQH